ncbi:DUF5677 domain-containing protein [Enterococcus caccae]|uniref:Uncharacterized protein n=1 Tax=Enterococcus caccae ATCC BAA-1240 TaxID=1158612 RepID=R3WD28_9ENTE|nr:DUF5677 domain-containing protein [Enterococcus caccae]EOL45806.1 hypothetical protein UC7_01603 [Enterococcus caccae ATCC BAA-1240]EOT61002.1 hypothetical protein I580_01904 [Enterococcus caccae ATCC BAA-1240]OJG27967.1 hypothetical protein RU98_GL002176 [Enterococcus caccae]
MKTIDQIKEDFTSVLIEVFRKSSLEEVDTGVYLVSTEIAYEVFDIFQSVVVLIQNNRFAGVKSLIRIMLENYVYLRYILLEDSERRSNAYKLNIYREMDFQNSEQNNNSNLEIMKKKDPELNSLNNLVNDNKSEIESYIKELDSIYGHRLKPWYNDDKKTKSIKRLFSRVEKSHLYDGIYRYLCLETHGGDGIKHIVMEGEYTKLQPTLLDKINIENIIINLLEYVTEELKTLL